MNLANVKTGDIVRVDKRGQTFYGFVTEKRRGELSVLPIDNRNTWRTAQAEEVKDFWKKAGRYHRKRKV